MDHRFRARGARATALRVARAAFVMLSTALGVVWFAPAPAWAADAVGPQPFGHPCTLESSGVRFCPTANLDARVPSFDGAPLDVDVTLPPSGSGPWPVIIMASPTGGDKTFYESTSSDGAANFGPDYSNVWFAQQGYTVVTYSYRGTFNSCGTVQSRAGYAACDPVQFEFADQRYDARDAQWLLGSLVDQHIAAPGALGMTGDSLGSIETLQVALLKDRVRLPNGTYAPWTSPNGTPLQLGAAYSNASISDVLDSAMPNGRFLSFQPHTATNDHSPIGVIKASFAGVFAAGTTPASSYWDLPSGPDGFDLPAQIALAEASPPDSPALASFAQEIYDYHQAIGIPAGTGPAPLLIEDGWDDVPVNGATQALRVVDYLKQAPNANVALQLLDWGHPLAQNKPADVLAAFAQGTDFFNHYLKGATGGPAPGSITAHTATCPATAPSDGPFTAAGIDALNPGAVRFSSAPAQQVSTGGDPAISAGLDWLVAGVGGGAGACQPFPATNAPGTAVYSAPVTTTFTTLGLPTMKLDVNTSGTNGQLNARLWDVAPDGTETYVSRGTYALTNNQSGTITWQMWGAGHTFPAGHTMRVELLAHDPPTERPSLSPFTVSVSNFTIEIPSHDPADGGEIGTPTFTGPHA